MGLKLKSGEKLGGGDIVFEGTFFFKVMVEFVYVGGS